MRLGYWTAELPNDLEHFGFALHPQSARHVGVLYHLDDGIVRFCHFAWHGDLRNEIASSGYLWANCYLWGNCGLDNYTKRFLAANFHTISLENKDCIPYGIDQNGSCFDENNRLLPLPLGKGMTCATFIMAVFRSLGMPLIREETWPKGREADKQWAREVVDTMKYLKVPEQHFQAVEKDIDNVSRFHPSEVAAAISSEMPPMEFAEAERLSKEILAELALAHTAMMSM
jgi:hypothetical protein